MSLAQVYDEIAADKPQLIYVTGKTSTGKSTFARRLADELGYVALELDDVVKNVAASGAAEDISLADVFVEVFRHRNRLDWIGAFVERCRKLIDASLAQSRPVVIEGALANAETLSELVAGYEDFSFIYFHPGELEPYIRNLTARFKTSSRTYDAGLPSAFWRLIDPTAFTAFCHDDIITKSLVEAIRSYALASQLESQQRLEAFERRFSNIRVVEVI